MRSLRSWVMGLAALLGLHATAAHAFSLETSFSDGCHEGITVSAVGQAPWPAGLDEPGEVAPALRDNLPFRVPADAGAWTIGLLIGLRNNDLHGGSVATLFQRPWIDFSDHDQGAHCLRASGEDFVPGDAAAVAACQTFVARQLEAAVAADDAELIEVQVALKFQVAPVLIPRRAYHLGRAMHALQDSFSHTFRSADFRKIVTVFNYVDPALDSTYSADKDGFPHESKFDRCDGQDDFSVARVQAAVDASAGLLRSVQEQRDAALRQGVRPHATVDALISSEALAWISLEAGCDAANGFCGADSRYNSLEAPAGCSTIAATGSQCTVLASAFLMFAAPARRRRRGVAPRPSRSP